MFLSIAILLEVTNRRPTQWGWFPLPGCNLWGSLGEKYNIEQCVMLDLDYAGSSVSIFCSGFLFFYVCSVFYFLPVFRFHFYFHIYNFVFSSLSILCSSQCSFYVLISFLWLFFYISASSISFSLSCLFFLHIFLSSSHTTLKGYPLFSLLFLRFFFSADWSGHFEVREIWSSERKQSLFSWNWTRRTSDHERSERPLKHSSLRGIL